MGFRSGVIWWRGVANDAGTQRDIPSNKSLTEIFSMGKLGLCHKRKDHLCKRESAVAHSFENIISVLIMNAVRSVCYSLVFFSFPQVCCGLSYLDVFASVLRFNYILQVCCNV